MIEQTMKQLLLPAAIAICLHMVFLSLIPVLFKPKHENIFTKAGSVMISMSYRQPIKIKEPVKKEPVTKKIIKKDLVKNKVSGKKKVKKKKPAPSSSFPTEKPLLEIEPNLISKPQIKQEIVKEKSIRPQQISLENKIAMPRYKENQNPKYPAKAKKRGYQGIVELMVLVSSKGTVLNLWIYKSSGYIILDNTAVNAVKKWLFEPAAVQEKPVEMWVKIPVKFELK